VICAQKFSSGVTYRVTALRKARRNPKAAAALQRPASLVGGGAKWRITIFLEVARWPDNGDSHWDRFGWDVGEGRRSDSAGGQPEPEEVAERPSQAPNGSAARLRDSISHDERAWREAKRAGAKSAQAPSPTVRRVGHGDLPAVLSAVRSNVLVTTRSSKTHGVTKFLSGRGSGIHLESDGKTKGNWSNLRT